MKKYKTKAQISQAGWGIDFAHRYSFLKSKYAPKRIRLHEFQYYRKIENFKPLEERNIFGQIK